MRENPGARTLVVLPSPVDPALDVLGLPLLLRIILSAERAGFDATIVIPAEGYDAAVEEVVAGIGAARVGDEESTEVGPGRVVMISSALLPDRSWLRTLLGITLPGDGACVIGEHGLVVDLDRPLRLSQIVGSRRSVQFADVASTFEPVERRALEAADAFPLEDGTSIGGAEDWLSGTLIKENEGFMSRHVERRISIAVSRRLVRTRITPNQMTLISVGVGLVGAAFFLSVRPAMELSGALFFLLHSILDGCDGELARLRFQESRFGGVLDFWGDNVVHSAVFLCIAIGWAVASGSDWPLLAGVLAAGATLMSAGLVFARTMEGDGQSPLFTSVSRQQSALSKIADYLARRDFIYLVVILSAFGHADWFLLAAAIGAPVFFIVLLWITFSGDRAGRKVYE